MIEGKEVYQGLPDFGGGIPYFYSGNWGVLSEIAKARKGEALFELLSLTEGGLFE